MRRPGSGPQRRGIRVAFSSVAGIPSPDSILGAALTGWYDDGSATMTGTTWSNRVGGGTDLTQGNASFRPVSGTTINGRATLAFDGTDDRMDAAAISGMLSASAFCVWIVGRVTGTLDAGPPTVTGNRGWISDSGGYLLASVHSDCRGLSFDTATRVTSAVGTMTSGTVYQARLRLDSGTLYYRIRDSGGPIGEGSVASGNLGSVAGLLRVGASYTPGFPGSAACDVASVVSMNTAPSAGQMSAMDTWTFSRWGV